tara:strand:+ start:883 stop:1992 length:1110 start_codon:yes stop_codon:yes gene_type:complete
MIPLNGDKQKKKGFLETVVTEGGKVAGGVVVGGAALAGGKALVTHGLPAAGRGALALGKAGYSAVSTGFGVTKIPDVVKGIPSAVKKVKAAPGKAKAAVVKSATDLTKGMGKDIAKATQQGLSEAMKPVSKTRAFAGEAGKRGIPSQVKIPKGTNTLAMYGQPQFKNPIGGKIGEGYFNKKGKSPNAVNLKKQMEKNVIKVTTEPRKSVVKKTLIETGTTTMDPKTKKMVPKYKEVKTKAGRGSKVKDTTKVLETHDTRSPKVRRQVKSITDRAERDISKIQASNQPQKIKDARTANVVKRAGKAANPITRKAAIKQGLRMAARAGSTAAMAFGPVGIGVGLATKALINVSTAHDIYKVSKEVLPKRKR